MNLVLPDPGGPTINKLLDFSFTGAFSIENSSLNRCYVLQSLRTALIYFCMRILLLIYLKSETTLLTES